MLVLGFHEETRMKSVVIGCCLLLFSGCLSNKALLVETAALMTKEYMAEHTDKEKLLELYKSKNLNNLEVVAECDKGLKESAESESRFFELATIIKDTANTMTLSPELKELISVGLNTILKEND